MSVVLASPFNGNETHKIDYFKADKFVFLHDILIEYIIIDNIIYYNTNYKAE